METPPTIPRVKRLKGMEGLKKDEPLKEIGAGHQPTRIPWNIPKQYNEHFTVKMPYIDNYLLNCQITAGGIATAANQTFRFSSIYDCDYTNAGHQPNQRDAWASVYDYYAVVSVDYKVIAYNSCVQDYTWTGFGSHQRLGGAILTLMRSTELTDIGGSGYDCWEHKHAENHHIRPEERVILQGTLTHADFMLNATQEDSDTIWTAVGANPTVPRYFGITVLPQVTAGLSGLNKDIQVSINCWVELMYTVQFAQWNPGLRETPS